MRPSDAANTPHRPGRPCQAAFDKASMAWPGKHAARSWPRRSLPSVAHFRRWCRPAAARSCVSNAGVSKRPAARTAWARMRGRRSMSPSVNAACAPRSVHAHPRRGAGAPTGCPGGVASVTRWQGRRPTTTTTAAPATSSRDVTQSSDCRAAMPPFGRLARLPGSVVQTNSGDDRRVESVAVLEIRLRIGDRRFRRQRRPRRGRSRAAGWPSIADHIIGFSCA